MLIIRNKTYMPPKVYLLNIYVSVAFVDTNGVMTHRHIHCHRRVTLGNAGSENGLESNFNDSSRSLC